AIRRNNDASCGEIKGLMWTSFSWACAYMAAPLHSRQGLPTPAANPMGESQPARLPPPRNILNFHARVSVIGSRLRQSQ
ncbi:MAG: hypothetical protein ACIARQ_14215, partial [Phycisphaerales bacterium JB061]